MSPNLSSMKRKVYLYDKIAAELISKLKPAFEQDITEDLQLSEDHTDLSNLSISSTTSCSTCGISFGSIEDQRQHFKLDWHRFNIQNKLKGLKAVSEDQFEAQLDEDQVSLSGSDSDSANDDGLAEKTQKHPKVFYTHSESGEVYSIHKAILPDFSKTNPDLNWAFLMLGGGHFAGAIFRNNEAILHKTFHCYTVRAKQGGSQGMADNKGGHHKSAGASLRRYNEQSLVQHVQDILATWKSELEKCSLIFYRAVSGNLKVIFGKMGKNSPAILDKTDTRLVPIPFPTRRATFKEVKRVHEILMTIELHKESLDEIKGKLVSKDERKSRGFAKGSSPVKRKEIRRSKSRDSPVRELPDFVQSLANEADSQSEPDEENLEEYEVNARTSRRASKAGGKKVVIQHEQELLNSLVTACKTGDLKLLNLLLETDPSQVKAQILESFGESKLTLLHIAAAEGHAKIIQALMENGADPTIRDKFKKTPYSYCPDKNSRSSFRRYQASNPEQWDYAKANFPQGNLLTSVEEARMAQKRAEKKKAQKAAKKEKEKEEKEIEKQKKAEEQERERFLKLSDREKRALAAEKRLLAQNMALPSVPRCFQCGIDISGQIPFEYNEYRFCKPACVKEHRKSKS